MWHTIGQRCQTLDDALCTLASAASRLCPDEVAYRRLDGFARPPSRDLLLRIATIRRPAWSVLYWWVALANATPDARTWCRVSTLDLQRLYLRIQLSRPPPPTRREQTCLFHSPWPLLPRCSRAESVPWLWLRLRFWGGRPSSSASIDDTLGCIRPSGAGWHLVIIDLQAP